jgi:hypothetical protein
MKQKISSSLKKIRILLTGQDLNPDLKGSYTFAINTKLK